jgi:hypothetical protein
MTRFFTTACLRTFCIALQTAALGMTAAEAAMLWSQPASVGTVARRVIGPTEARTFWDDPEIKKLRAEAENAWDFTAPDGVPGFGSLSPDDARKNFEHVRGIRR